MAYKITRSSNRLYLWKKKSIWHHPLGFIWHFIYCCSRERHFLRHQEILSSEELVEQLFVRDESSRLEQRDGLVRAVPLGLLQRSALHVRGVLQQESGRAFQRRSQQQEWWWLSSDTKNRTDAQNRLRSVENCVWSCSWDYYTCCHCNSM